MKGFKLRVFQHLLAFNTDWVSTVLVLILLDAYRFSTHQTLCIYILDHTYTLGYKSSLQSQLQSSDHCSD
jgi:hypothetical protein